MSNATTTLTKETIRPKAHKDSPPFGSFEMPKFEMPAMSVVENTGAAAKENYEKMKTANDRLAAMVEASYSTALKGATAYGLKVIDINRINAQAAFDLFSKLVAVKSPSEAIELSTSQARQHIDAVSAQSKELWALAQKAATDVVEPIRTGLSEVLQ